MKDLLLMIFGRCRHRNVTRPLTLTSIPLHVTCLDCGTRLSYDWSTMSVGEKIEEVA